MGWKTHVKVELEGLLSVADVQVADLVQDARVGGYVAQELLVPLVGLLEVAEQLLQIGYVVQHLRFGAHNAVQLQKALQRILQISLTLVRQTCKHKFRIFFYIIKQN